MNSLEYKNSQFKYFCATIGFDSKTVEDVVKSLDSYYKERVEVKKNKHGELKRYNDGTIKKRTIRPSYRTLKKIQSRIKTRILEPIELPNQIHGGVKKRSNISNAKPHQGNKFQFTTDLQNFFPGISSKTVYDTFLQFGFSNHFSHWLTKLTTWKYELPQGTPTSTHIANIVFMQTDMRLIELCNKHNIVYTRYVDDLTFSSPKCFKPILNDILEIVIESGFKISYRKTKYDGRQNITGIDVFNNFIDAPSRIKEKAQEEIKTCADFKPYLNYLHNIRKTNKRKASSQQRV